MADDGPDHVVRLHVFCVAPRARTGSICVMLMMLMLMMMNGSRSSLRKSLPWSVAGSQETAAIRSTVPISKRDQKKHGRLLLPLGRFSPSFTVTVISEDTSLILQSTGHGCNTVRQRRIDAHFLASSSGKGSGLVQAQQPSCRRRSPRRAFRRPARRRSSTRSVFLEPRLCLFLLLLLLFVSCSPTPAMSDAQQQPCTATDAQIETSAMSDRP